MLQLAADIYQSTWLKVNLYRSMPASEIYSKCVSSINPSVTDPTKTVIRKCLIQSVGERDFSAQETAHLLLSLPLYRCTFNFVTVSLDGNRKVRPVTNASGSEDLATELSLLDTYAIRMEHYSTTFPDVISLNLVQFCIKILHSQCRINRENTPCHCQNIP